MKEVSSSVWTFQMIILFMLIFACFLTLVLSYNKAYTIKNRMLTIIEKYEGVTDESFPIINNFVSEHSYKTQSKCPEGWIGAKDIYSSDATVEHAQSGQRYYYCFKELEDSANDQIYYQVKVFYKFNLPVIGDIATYKIEGETKTFIGVDNRVTKE